MTRPFPTHAPRKEPKHLIARVASIVALMLSGTLAFAVEEPGGGTLEHRLSTTIDRSLAGGRIVGAVVIVMRDGKVIYHRAAGYRDREARIPISEDAIFRLASSSKAITSAAAMALIDRGLLRLDDPITKWLPDFDPKAPDGSTPIITIRELLTHTSGLSYPFWEPKGGPYDRARVSSGLDLPGISMEEELHRIKTAGLVFVPGTDWRYSLSIDVLGAVIAKADRRSLPAAVRELITRPLKMADTGYAVTDVQRLAVPYFNATPTPKRMADVQDVNFGDDVILTFAPSRIFNTASFPSGGAGMLGTAGDYVRFLEALRTGGGPILKSATVKSMMTNQVRSLKILSGPGWGFGFGAAVVTDAIAAGMPVGTWSWSGAYGTSWFIDSANKLTVVAFTDTSPEGDSGPFAMEIRSAIYGIATQSRNGLKQFRRRPCRPREVRYKPGDSAAVVVVTEPLLELTTDTGYPDRPHATGRRRGRGGAFWR
jgi:CubicO group peptidase (beta-lactamase class C family)